jgi:hypothetical protein
VANLTQLKAQLERAKKAASGIRKKAEKTMAVVVYSAETTGTAFLASYMRGRMGDAQGRLQIQGVDVDLLGGLVGLGTSFIVSDAWGSHAASIGTGGLACYATHKGFELGRASKNKTGTSGRQQLSGAQPRMSDTGAFNHAWAHAER